MYYEQDKMSYDVFNPIKSQHMQHITQNSKTWDYSHIPDAFEILKDPPRLKAAITLQKHPLANKGPGIYWIQHWFISSLTSV